MLVFGIPLSMAVIYLSIYALLRWQQVLVAVQMGFGNFAGMGPSVCHTVWFVQGGRRFDNSLTGRVKAVLAPPAYSLFKPLRGVESRYRNRGVLQEYAGLMSEEPNVWQWVAFGKYDHVAGTGSMFDGRFLFESRAFTGAMRAPQTANR